MEAQRHDGWKHVWGVWHVLSHAHICVFASRLFLKLVHATTTCVMSHNWSHGAGGSWGGGGNWQDLWQGSWQGSWQGWGDKSWAAHSTPGSQQPDSIRSPAPEAVAAAASNSEWHNPQVAESAAHTSDNSWVEWHNPQVAESAAHTSDNSERHNPWADWRNPQVAESAAPTSDDFQRMDEATMQDMPQQMRGEAVGEEAFQNYRRSILKKLDQYELKKAFLMVWLKIFRKEDICMEDLCFTEDDMEHFLNTVCSFETHEREWYKEFEERQDPQHKFHGIPMPATVPLSYMRVFKIKLSQIHSEKFKQHFGVAIMDGTFHTPIQMFPTQVRKVAESAASVAESPASVAESVASVAESAETAETAALATRFQLRLFSADTRLAIDYKTSFLDHDRCQQLVTDVSNFKQVKELACHEFRKEKTLLHAGYKQILAKVFMRRWERAQDSEGSLRKVGQKVLHEQQSDQEKEKMDVEGKEEDEAQPQETPKPQEEGRVADLDSLQPQKPEASAPPTHDAELDEALADLAEPVATAAESAASPVAESAADPQVHFSPHVEVVKYSAITSYPKIDAAAHAAYDAITKFRQEVIQERIQSCSSWIQRNMNDFKILSVEVFGSTCYHLPLCTSDVDMVVILAPRQSKAMFVEIVRKRCNTSPFFDFSRCNRKDTFQTSYMGMAVDIKPVRLSRESDAACNSSDSLRSLIEQRMMQHQEPKAILKFKLQAILIFKLLLHHLNIVQHHWQNRGKKFKAISLCFWAVCVLDGMRWENHGVGDFVYALCKNFVDFDWQLQKVVVSAANQISLQPKGGTIGAVAIMLKDGINSAKNVNLQHLKLSQGRIETALPSLEQFIDEALKGQEIMRKNETS